jgi:hypothetical protein
MLPSHAALCWLTGSLEMSVFHTLFAGNSGQLAAPGTVVPGDFAGAGGFVTVAVGAGVAGGADAGVALGVSVLGPAVSVPPDELVAATPVRLPGFAASFAPAPAGLAAQPAAQARAAAATAMRNVNFLDGKCPVRRLTVEILARSLPGIPGNREIRHAARRHAARRCRVPLQCNPWRHAPCVN